MRAKLVTGEIVELKKECQCVTHDEPCWIHMNDLTKRLNYQNYKWALEAKFPVKIDPFYAPIYVSCLNNALHCYARDESLRLQELIKQMEKLGIEELLQDTP